MKPVIYADKLSEKNKNETPIWTMETNSEFRKCDFDILVWTADRKRFLKVRVIRNIR
jgi:hypothetical protein